VVLGTFIYNYFVAIRLEGVTSLRGECGVRNVYL
jgi:hypothetical protein